MGIALILLSLVGLYTCFAFWQSGKGNHRFCIHGQCLKVEGSRWGKLLYLPNWVFGSLFYGAIIAAGIFMSALPGLHDTVLYNDVSLLEAVRWLAILASVASMLMSFLLLYGLRVVLHVHCYTCYLAHVVNTGIFIALLVG